MSLPDPPLAKPELPWTALGLGAIAVATLAKLYLIGTGPDLESDGYGHALAARLLLERPTDPGVHWVWLPLGHFVAALSLLLGAGMEGMRYLNCALTSLLALGVACCVERDRALRWTTAAIVALSPLALATGESGALEPLFAILVVVSAWALRRGHDRSAGIAAALAALSRYEGWLLAPLYFWYWWRSGRARAGIWSFALPLATIGVYTGVRATDTGALAFLHENSAFAGAFFAGVAARWPVPPHASWMSIWYALIVPALVLGPLLPFALAKVPWLVRGGPRPLTGALLVILIFLSVGFVARQHLGLPRHALPLTPLYALAAAAGVLGAARFLHRRLRLERFDVERWSFACATFALLVFAASRALPTVLDRAAQHREAYREELAAARELRTAWTPRTRVFCDVTAVETLSDLPPSSFVRWQLPDTPLGNLALEHAAGRDVLVVGTELRAQHLRRDLRELARTGRLILYRYFPTDAPTAGSSNVEGSL